MKKPINQVKLEFMSRSVNEGFARASAACFAAQMDPTLDELNDFKTAVSEAVTNAIVHAYPEELGRVSMRLRLFADGLVEVQVRDWGVGIPDIPKARTPCTPPAGRSAAAWASPLWRASPTACGCAPPLARGRR